MVRKARRILIYILFCMAFIPLSLDALLWHIDPFGTRIMVYNWITLAEVDAAHPTGYQYPEGVYDLGFYSVTILPDGKRLVPDSGNGDCTIAFVGDSVTWGHGVSDSDTFANQLAIRFPDVTILNTARNRYSVSNVAASIDHYSANGYVWTMISNDTEPFAQPDTYSRKPSALELYVTTLAAEYRYTQRLDSLTWGDYAPLAHSMIARPDTLVFGFENDPLAMEAAAWGVILIPYPADVVSIADKHPNTIGHQEITNSMLPFVEPFITRVCHA